MLKFMEDEEKIFRAWLKKHVKIDRKITGKKLSELTGIKGPSITSYHSGRLIDGERIWPAIPFDKRVAILTATGVSHEEMMHLGKKELEPEEAAEKEDIKAYVRELLKENTFDDTSRENNNILSYPDHKIARHYNIIEKFKNQPLAFEINQMLLEIEELAPELMELAKEQMDLIKIKAEILAAKKKKDGKE